METFGYWNRMGVIGGCLMPEPSNDMSEFVLSTAPINHIDYSKHNMEYTRVQKNNDKIVAKGGKEYLFFKRLFDIVSSSLVLILFGWFILLLMFIKFCEYSRYKNKFIKFVLKKLAFRDRMC